MPRRPKKTSSVREPIQVYLAQEDRSLLDRVALATGLSRAEVLRRGLRTLGAETLEDSNPVMEFLDSMAAEPWPKDMPRDAAVRHDEILADAYVTGAKRGRR